jgi:hypothetical protein
MFVSSTPHGFNSGDAVSFGDAHGSGALSSDADVENSVWECLSPARDYTVASTPTVMSFTLANAPYESSALQFNCNSNGDFIVRRSLQSRLIVRPGKFCASQSYTLGPILSLATAGKVFSYSMELRDSFQNLILQELGLVAANIYDASTNKSCDQLLASFVLSDGRPTLFLSTTVSGVYRITLFDVSSAVFLDNTPILVRVLPQSFCAATSSMQRIMTRIIMNRASRIEFYARDSFGNKLVDALEGYSTKIMSCVPDAGFAELSITPSGGLSVSFSRTSGSCSCCTNLHVSLTYGSIYNGNGTSSILSPHYDAAGVLTELQIIREGSGYVSTPIISLLSLPLFAVKMVLVNGSGSFTIVLAYSDVKINGDTYSVLHSFPTNPGRGRVFTVGMVLLHGGLMATYYALDAQLPLARGTNVFDGGGWASKLSPCLTGVMSFGVSISETSCNANFVASAVKFSGVVHREGKVAPLIMFMAVYSGTLLKVYFSSRMVSDAIIESQGELGLLFFSAVVPMVPSNYKKILADFHVEYAGAAIPSFSFPLFAGTACSKVLAISSITSAVIEGNLTLFHTNEGHKYEENVTIVRLIGLLPSPLSQGILYRVGRVWHTTFSLSILGDSASVSNISTSAYVDSSASVEEVQCACGMRAPFELGSSRVEVDLV